MRVGSPTVIARELRVARSGEDEMDLRDYLRVVRKRWVSIALITLLGLGAAGLFTYLQPKVYTATAQTFVAISNDGASSADILSGATFTLQRVKSYTQIVDSPDVLQPVIDELKLNVTTEQLARNVSATSPLDTVLIEVQAKDGSAEQAAAVANAVAKQLGLQIEKLEEPKAGGASPVKVTLTHRADVPASPSSPRTLVNLALGLLVGLALGLAYAFIRESLDTTIKSVEDVSDIVGATPVGFIPFDPEAKDKPLAALELNRTGAEAFRTVRTNLAFVDVDHPKKVIVVTSAVPGEGKTTTAINLAITMAQTGQRVALVECDLRRPKVEDYLGLAAGVGLTSVLTGQATLEAALQPWNRGLMGVLAAGPLPPNPAELLGSRQMQSLLDHLRGICDAVIIDAPPLLPVTDSAVLAHHADGALLVVRHGRTTREQVRRAVEVLEQADASVLGSLVNFVPARKRGESSYYYGSYYGGYGGYSSTGRHAPRGAKEADALVVPWSTTQGAQVGPAGGGDVVPADRERPAGAAG